MASLGGNLLYQHKYIEAELLLRDCLKICEAKKLDIWWRFDAQSLLGGALSLRAEINAAQSGDTIQFALNLAGQTIALTRGELLINKNLTITGLGADQLTISGNNSSRVFEVAGGMQVNLSGLTISNGMANGGDGGGILVDTGAVLTISNSALSGNNATYNRKGIGGHGAGIENNGTATVSNGILFGDAGERGKFSRSPALRRGARIVSGISPPACRGPQDAAGERKRLMKDAG